MNAPRCPDHPTLALRVGITGARTLEEPAQVKRLCAQVRAVLAVVRNQLHELADSPPVQAAYRQAEHSQPEPVLRFISPLARGADRLAARVALEPALGYQLHVPMPFPQTEYEKDFDTPADLDEFRVLFKQAGDNWLALDGSRGNEVNRAYEAVGRYVVRHCDLLIAIWDGGPGGGRGGTSDVVRYAASVGVPVWWIHPSEQRDAVWIADIMDLRHPRSEPIGAETALHNYLQTYIPPPAPPHPHRPGVLGWLSQRIQPAHSSPETVYFGELELKSRWYWRAYAAFARWASSGHQIPWKPLRVPEDSVAHYWFARFGPADGRATDYAARYRSAYVWVFFLATFTVIFGAIASMSGVAAAVMTDIAHQPDSAIVATLERLTLPFALLEFAALSLILVIVLFGMGKEWHERSIEYRLFAELCRKEQVLAPLGWALPIAAVRRMATPDQAVQDRAAWVSWLFAAEQRAALLPRGELAHAAKGPSGNAILMELIVEQCEYHDSRAQMADKAGHKLEWWGGSLFLFIFACVIAKIILSDFAHHPDWAVPLGFLATVLPAVSAAFVGIRAYAEFQLLAVQSRHMVSELKRARARVERLDMARPLASQDLGAEAVNVATLMLQDLEGWARLFRVKGIEAG